MGLTDEAQHPNFILTTIDAVLRWGRGYSIWFCNAGIACCSLEMATAGGPRYDLARFGSEAVRATPRQSDLLIVPGPITKKIAPVFTRVYNQMAEPRWVIAMGSCAISGGAFRDSYSVTKGVDTILPVDVYIPGCPVRPEALIYGILMLRKQILSTSTIGESRREPIYVPPVLAPEWEAEFAAFMDEGEVCER